MIQILARRTAGILFVTALTVVTVNSWAQLPKPAGTPATPTAPKEDPSTQILSDTLHYDDIKRESTFTGNVVMTRGLMTMNSDVLSLKEESDGAQFGTATVQPGKRVFIRQERPENFEVLEGVGQRAEYNGRDEIFDLIGQAVVTRFICGQKFDTVSGQRVRYSQKTDIYEAFSGPDSANTGGRVRSIAQPRARADAAVAECRAKQGSLPSPAAASGVAPGPAAAAKN
jgi:lipopolysaccharide export system protein LptA